MPNHVTSRALVIGTKEQVERFRRELFTEHPATDEGDAARTEFDLSKAVPEPITNRCDLPWKTRLLGAAMFHVMEGKEKVASVVHDYLMRCNRTFGSEMIPSDMLPKFSPEGSTWPEAESLVVSLLEDEGLSPAVGFDGKPVSPPPKTSEWILATVNRVVDLTSNGIASDDNPVIRAWGKYTDSLEICTALKDASGVDDGLPVGWYEWRIENWGTKWNAYSTRLGEIEDLGVDADTGEHHFKLEFSFQTAWSPPRGVFEAINDMFPKELSFSVLSFDEGWMFASSWSCVKGTSTCAEIEEPTPILYQAVYGKLPTMYLANDEED